MTGLEFGYQYHFLIVINFVLSNMFCIHQFFCLLLSVTYVIKQMTDSFVCYFLRAPWQAEWPLVRREPAEGGREGGKGHLEVLFERG